MVIIGDDDNYGNYTYTKCSVQYRCQVKYKVYIRYSFSCTLCSVQFMFIIFRLIFSRAGGWQSHERADAVQPGLVRCCEPLVSSGPQWLHCFSADLGLLQTLLTGSDVRRCRANILFLLLILEYCQLHFLSADRRHRDRNRISLSPSSAPRGRIGFWH